MTTLAPGPWEFALLTLAAFRVYRLAARDTIFEPLRAVLTYPDETSLTLAHDSSAADAEMPKTWRVYLSTLLRCPWCLGFYTSIAAYLAWLAWPTAVLVAASPLAISAAVALITKNLDRQEP